jgi:branched-chain amino acid transport system ATP-binding protein
VPLLDVRNLHVHYGKIHALRGVSLRLCRDQIVTLIGANGAGKSTTLRAISGILAMSDGDVVLEGESLKELPAHRFVAKGIVQVPEGRRIFGRLTVAENLRLGAFLSKDKRWIGDMEARARHDSGAQGAADAGGRHLVRRRAADAGDRPRPDGQPAGAAARRAKHGTGAPSGAEDLRDRRRHPQARRAGAAGGAERVPALTIADYGYVIETGEVVQEGPGHELLANPQVKEAYLG